MYKDFIVPLKPTLWQLHVFIGDRKKASKKLKLIFGESENYYYNEISNPMVSRIYSERKKEQFIVMYVPSFKDLGIIVHEVAHVVWHLGDAIGHNWGYEGQELFAIMNEYIFTEIMKKKNV